MFFGGIREESEEPEAARCALASRRFDARSHRGDATHGTVKPQTKNLHDLVLIGQGFHLRASAPNFPTKIIHAKIRWLNMFGKSPMDMRIPPLSIKIMLESDPLKSRILVRRLAVL